MPGGFPYVGQARRKSAIEFHGDQVLRTSGKQIGQRASSRPDFQHGTRGNVAECLHDA